MKKTRKKCRVKKYVWTRKEIKQKIDEVAQLLPCEDVLVITPLRVREIFSDINIELNELFDKITEEKS